MSVDPVLVGLVVVLVLDLALWRVAVVRARRRRERRIHEASRARALDRMRVDAVALVDRPLRPEWTVAAVTEPIRNRRNGDQPEER